MKENFFYTKIEFLADQTIIPSNGQETGATKPNEYRTCDPSSPSSLSIYCLFIILNNKILI